MRTENRGIGRAWGWLKTERKSKRERYGGRAAEGTRESGIKAKCIECIPERRAKIQIFI